MLGRGLWVPEAVPSHRPPQAQAYTDLRSRHSHVKFCADGHTAHGSFVPVENLYGLRCQSHRETTL